MQNTKRINDCSDPLTNNSHNLTFSQAWTILNETLVKLPVIVRKLLYILLAQKKL